MVHPADAADASSSQSRPARPQRRQHRSVASWGASTLPGARACGNSSSTTSSISVAATLAASLLLLSRAKGRHRAHHGARACLPPTDRPTDRGTFPDNAACHLISPATISQVHTKHSERPSRRSRTNNASCQWPLSTAIKYAAGVFSSHARRPRATATDKTGARRQRAACGARPRPARSVQTLVLAHMHHPYVHAHICRCQAPVTRGPAMLLG